MDAEQTLQWDLGSDEIVQEFTFRHQNFFLHMKPYRAFDLKQLLRAEYEIKTQADGEYRKVLEEHSVKASRDFFNKHFIKFTGLIVEGQECTPDQILEWVKKKSFGLEENVIKNMLGLVKGDNESESVNPFDLSDTEVIRLKAKLVDPVTKQSSDVAMNHHVIVEEKHYRQFKQSHSTKIDAKKGVWERPVNHDVREQIYNQTIQSVDGMCLNGKACSLETKEEWVALVPYWHKLLVTNELFQEVEAKN